MGVLVAKKNARNKMKNKIELVFIYTTVPTAKAATDLSQILLEKNWIACANIFSKMRSLYLWNGKLEKSTEYPVILKTEKRLFKKIERFIQENHPYKCPCLLSWEIGQGNEPYIQWLMSNLRPVKSRNGNNVSP